MLVDRNARGWIVATIVMFVVAIGCYIPYAMSRLHGPSGGSVAGLVYASVGSLFMLIALALGLRKRLRTLQKIGPIPAGRAHTWMQAHVWLGLVSYPIILCHAGFRFGPVGSMTWVIMWLFTIVFVSGIVGLLIQNFVPRAILERVPLETIYEQHARVLALSRGQAKQIVDDATREDEAPAFEFDAVPAGATVATLAPARLSQAKEQLRAFYDNDIVRYLGDEPKTVPQLGTDRAAKATFDSIRASMPAELIAPVNDLEYLVTERRQMLRQRIWFHWLHGWLLCHVPLSYALMILATIHAVYALRY